MAALDVTAETVDHGRVDVQLNRLSDLARALNDQTMALAANATTPEQIHSLRILSRDLAVLTVELIQAVADERA